MLRQGTGTTRFILLNYYSISNNFNYFRHFHSLRLLKRDYGWIATLLEEAENERMHLLVCLKMFKASMVTRTVVVATQVVMTPLLMLVYAIHPKSMHRFVGYLEETACHTYVNVINHIETPGTQLNKAWIDLPAPPIAVGYWKLDTNASWVDTLKCMVSPYMCQYCDHLASLVYLLDGR